MNFSAMQHPNVLLCLGVCEEPLCVVTEFMPKGSLYDYLRSKPLSDSAKMQIVSGVARGMLHLVVS